MKQSLFEELQNLKLFPLECVRILYMLLNLSLGTEICPIKWGSEFTLILFAWRYLLTP
jgi:hypothetical protein